MSLSTDMSSSPVSVACFKFEELYYITIGEFEAAILDVADGHGTTWRLGFRVSDDSYNISGSMCLAPKSNNATLVQELKSFSNRPIRLSAKVSLVVRNRLGKVVYEHNIPISTYRCNRTNNTVNNEIEFNFANWSALKEMLVDDALIIDAIIQYDQGRLHVPKNPFNDNMLKLLDSGEDKDVFFNVDGRIMSAHKLILKANSSVLATLCIGGSSRESPIHIKNTRPEVFRFVVLFLYGGNTPGDALMIKYGREIIDVCDRFDVVGLKIAVETVLVQKRVINVINVVDWIQFAHSKTCPLLKEYAMSYFMARYRDVPKADSYNKMKQCPALMEEVMMATLPSLDKDERFEKDKKSVNELRCELSRLKLDVDGSKDTLVARLDAQKK